MKRFVLLVAMAVIACAVAFGVTRRLSRVDTEDRMTWLRHEFHLTDEQAARIAQLDAAYEPICADHCERIAVARQRLKSLSQAGDTGSSAYAAAEADWTALRAECTRATRQQLEKVAAVMSPEDGRRYLEVIGAKLTNYDHQKPFGLQ